MNQIIDDIYSLISKDKFRNAKEKLLKRHKDIRNYMLKNCLQISFINNCSKVLNSYDLFIIIVNANANIQLENDLKIYNYLFPLNNNFQINVILEKCIDKYNIIKIDQNENLDINYFNFNLEIEQYYANFEEFINKYERTFYFNLYKMYDCKPNNINVNHDLNFSTLNSVKKDIENTQNLDISYYYDIDGIYGLCQIEDIHGFLASIYLSYNSKHKKQPFNKSLFVINNSNNCVKNSKLKYVYLGYLNISKDNSLEIYLYIDNQTTENNFENNFNKYLCEAINLLNCQENMFHNLISLSINKNLEFNGYINDKSFYFICNYINEKLFNNERCGIYYEIFNTKNIFQAKTLELAIEKIQPYINLELLNPALDISKNFYCKNSNNTLFLKDHSYNSKYVKPYNCYNNSKIANYSSNIHAERGNKIEALTVPINKINFYNCIGNLYINSTIRKYKDYNLTYIKLFNYIFGVKKFGNIDKLDTKLIKKYQNILEKINNDKFNKIYSYRCELNTRFSNCIDIDNIFNTLVNKSNFVIKNTEEIKLLISSEIDLFINKFLNFNNDDSLNKVMELYINEIALHEFFIRGGGNGQSLNYNITKILRDNRKDNLNLNVENICLNIDTKEQLEYMYKLSKMQLYKFSECLELEKTLKIIVSLQNSTIHKVVEEYFKCLKINFQNIHKGCSISFVSKEKNYNYFEISLSTLFIEVYENNINNRTTEITHIGIFNYFKKLYKNRFIEEIIIYMQNNNITYFPKFTKSLKPQYYDILFDVNINKNSIFKSISSINMYYTNEIVIQKAFEQKQSREFNISEKELFLFKIFEELFGSKRYVFKDFKNYLTLPFFIYCTSTRYTSIKNHKKRKEMNFDHLSFNIKNFGFLNIFCFLLENKRYASSPFGLEKIHSTLLKYSKNSEAIERLYSKNIYSKLFYIQSCKEKINEISKLNYLSEKINLSNLIENNEDVENLNEGEDFLVKLVDNNIVLSNSFKAILKALISKFKFKLNDMKYIKRYITDTMLLNYNALNTAFGHLINFKYIKISKKGDKLKFEKELELIC